MNISQLGIVTNAVLQNSQSRVAEVDRVKHEQSVQARETEVAQQAEQAEGIGVTHEEAAAGDRDADGRRLWEFPESPATEEAENQSPYADEPPHHTKDPTGQAGTQLDLDG